MWQPTVGMMTEHKDLNQTKVLQIPSHLLFFISKRFYVFGNKLWEKKNDFMIENSTSFLFSFFFLLLFLLIVNVSN